MKTNPLFLLAFLSLFLSGCLDEGGSSKKPDRAETPPAISNPEEPQPDESGPETPPVAPPLDPQPKPDDGNTTAPAPGFPEPTGAVLEEVNAEGFYDIDASGKPRAVRNDLNGNLPAMVQFVQNHSVDPSGNAAKNMPMLTSEREALLLVTPDPAGGTVRSLTLSFSVDGQTKPAIALRHPDELPEADRNSSDTRPDVRYSRRAWSAVLPWDWVKPGMSLSISDDRGRNGVLAGGAIDIAAPAELVINNVRLGLLTEPPRSNGHYMLLEPARAGTDYFQTVPVSRLIVAKYDEVILQKVMVASGTIYDTASAVEGSVYAGDMRENTAKSTFSVGINLANWGVTSSSMQSQQQPQVTQSVVVHHARGVYQNGQVNHGLSGGNSILTLIDSVGNEFSHEIGHHYGLGHYPGQNVEPKNLWDRHHADSGWGYIGHRQRMRANLDWAKYKPAEVPQFQKQYNYNWDSMSGGWPGSSLSRYTHYTGYSTYLKIQPSLDKAVLAADSPTGYRKWDTSTRKMEVFQPKQQSSNQVWYNGVDGNFPKPRRQGITVFTLLGGYDPVNSVGLLYPPARSNWGNVFDLPQPTADATAAQCWLSVDYAGGRNQRIALAPNRMQGNANKLHVQVAVDENPQQASLHCQAAGGTARELHRVSFPQNLPAIEPPVIIGREAGYQALRRIELPELEQALLTLQNQAVPTLNGPAKVLYDSYVQHAAELSAPARAQLERYRDLQQKALRLNRWMDAYQAPLQAGDQAAEQALLNFIEQLGLRSDPLLPPAQAMKVNNNCLRAESVGGVITPVIIAAAQCKGGAAETWLTDANGRIRNAQHPQLCLTDRGGSSEVGLSECNSNADAQSWNLAALPQVKRESRCLDLKNGFLSEGRGTLITYNCTNGGNQKWQGISRNDNLLLPLLQNRNLQPLLRLAAKP